MSIIGTIKSSIAKEGSVVEVTMVSIGILSKSPFRLRSTSVRTLPRSGLGAISSEQSLLKTHLRKLLQHANLRFKS